MPYVIFALKWRPNNFDEIIGQDNVVTTLKNAIAKNRLPHAYLFAGPRGVGKTSTARILAKALNCKNGTGVNPCGSCPVCNDISAGRSLDVIEIDGASNRGIDEIRALRENVKFAPAQAKFKIYIIDEVHQITSEGFNALLKTLEEPPPYVKFIFATTHPHKVIPTILSRCQRLDFRRIPALGILTQLEKIARAEKIEVSKEVLFAIAKSSDGSLRDAESVLDQLFSFAKENISLADIISMLGWVEQDFLFNITDKIVNKDGRGALILFGEIIDKGKDLNNLLANLIEHFRNLMVAKVTDADQDLIDLPQDVCRRLLEQSRSFTLEEIFYAFNILVNTQEVSKRMDSLRIPLEISLVKLADYKKTVNSTSPRVSPQKSIRDNPAAAPAIEEKKPQEPKKQDNEPVISGDAESYPVSLDNIREAWAGIVGNLEKVKMSVATYLNEGSAIKLENNVLTVAFPVNYSLHKESLESRENKAIIEKAILQTLNTQLRVNFILSKEAAGSKEQHSSSFVKSAIQTFKGRVIGET